MQKVSCIICAYNEEERIGGVLSATAGHPLLDEILVINDGSKDKTEEVAQRFPGVRVITMNPNGGKSRAFAAGVRAARNELLLMLDADLLGITHEALTQLIEPVLRGDVDATLTLRSNSLLLYKMIGLDFVSGERVYSRALIVPHLDEISALPGFGLEVYLNNLWIAAGLRIGSVWWKDVVNPRKYTKAGFVKGVADDARMIRQILRVMPLRRVLAQVYRMVRLRKRI